MQALCLDIAARVRVHLAGARPKRRRPGPHGSWRLSRLAGLAAAVALAGCGGGTTDPPGTQAAAQPDGAGQAARAGRSQADNAGARTTRDDAFRLLTQATFGPIEADIEHVMAVGAEGWIDEQLALPVSAHHLQRWNQDNADDPDGASQRTVVSSFFQEAVRADDQLRQRMTYALSQILVVSTQDLGLAGPKSQSAASWLDMLAHESFGNYRDLLEAATEHPAMGTYLSTMANRKEAPPVGRIPDQNFAREVMQLFSIGLVQLNLDGTPKDGPIDTYAAADIDGLSRVFTGYSWAGPDKTKERFFNDPGSQAPDRLYKPMQPYGQYHSLGEKAFLGVTIPASERTDPRGDLALALDTLAAHHNVGPFLARQLIQRFVTSNPSPRYVARVAAVWNDDGQGVRGNLAAVIKAILLDGEARSPKAVADDSYGKLREPVLRLTAFLRAYGAKSDSGKYLVLITDDPGTQLAQSPLRARSVFNFYRPGYVPQGGPAQRLGLALPEMQITDESTVAGYVNFMATAVEKGVGAHGLDGGAARPDVQPDYRASLRLARDPASLVADTTARLLGPAANDTLVAQLTGAVASITVPERKADGSNQHRIDVALHNRVHAATLLTLASPEFVTQK